MATIGFVTTSVLPAMPGSDLLTATALETLGHEVRSVRWEVDDPTGLDLLVFRSCWNYHLVEAEFRRWLGTLGSLRVVNSPEIVSWNLDKRYLLEVGQHAGIVATEIVEDAMPAEIALLCQSRGWERAVIKPAVGSTAYRSRRLLTKIDFESLSDEDVAGAMLVQPYLEEIETNGEYSLMFFGGEYSHAVIKRPASGDYRVQEEHGGSTARVEPEAGLREAAHRALGASPAKPAYARVDLVRTAAGPLVMEVELIEPELYIEHAPEAAGRFAQALTEGA
ncbi:MAG TPA: hypothetical protein VMI31_02525 [Fimbriimonadaceae bacterium]|nr:hypothetical protein [Fimbriimonadaceae bacterium]